MTTLIERDCEELTRPGDALRTIFENLPVGIIAADGEGRLLFSNPAAEKILGSGASFAPDDAGATVYGWYRPDQTTMLTLDQLPLARAVRGQEIIDELIFVRNFRRDAGVWIRLNGWPLKDSAGAIFGGFVMFSDFTRGREAMQLLVLLARVVEQTADNVVVTDTQGVIQYVNKSFETTSGYDHQEVLGRTPRVLKSGLHDAEFYRELWARLLDGQSTKGLIINRKKTGELYWLQQTITPMRDEAGQLTHFVSVAQDISELRKKQEQEFQLQLARDVQSRFYGTPPSLPGFEIGAAVHPAYETSGDYFDFISLADGSLMIAVGDVVGHGFGSALIMALTRAYLRCIASMEVSLDGILRRMNRMLLADLHEGQYVTLFLAHLNPARRTLAYASAGHLPGLLFSDAGELVRSFDSTGPPLGILPEITFSSRQECQLDAGQIMVLHTDGIAESTAIDGSPFGTQRILDYVRAHCRHPAHQIADGFYQAVRSFMKDELQADDITSVVIKVS